MWGAVIGAGISAASALAGNALNNAAQSNAASQSRDYGYQMAMLNYEAQKEFAQNGIRWRVADAKAAGLHPLAALGASPLGFSPSFGGGQAFSGSSDWSDTFNSLGNLGQEIGRAIDAKATEQERADRVQDESTLRKLQIQNAQLQNDRLSQQIIDNGLASVQALRTQAGQPPAMPQVIPTGRDGRTLPGQGDAHTTGLFEVKPPEVMASHPQTPYAEAGTHPELQFIRTGNGGYAPMRGTAAQQALEDDTLGSVRFNIRNGLGQLSSNQGYAPPREYLPYAGRDRDYYWLFNHVDGTWHPARHSDSRWNKVKTMLGLK